MILITLFQILYTKFLLPHRKEDNGWLVMAVITLFSDSLAHNYQETILMARTTSFVVKIVKEEFEVDNTFLQCSNALASSIFIELFDSSLGEDFTPLFSLTKLLKGIL
jgi:hypothetical protein